MWYYQTLAGYHKNSAHVRNSHNKDYYRPGSYLIYCFLCTLRHNKVGKFVTFLNVSNSPLNLYIPGQSTLLERRHTQWQMRRAKGKTFIHLDSRSIGWKLLSNCDEYNFSKSYFLSLELFTKYHLYHTYKFPALIYDWENTSLLRCI